MRLLFLPLFLTGLYLLARVLLPGPLGVVVGVACLAAGALWAVLTVRRSRSQNRE
jgi:hypothetical protein